MNKATLLVRLLTDDLYVRNDSIAGSFSIAASAW